MHPVSRTFRRILSILFLWVSVATAGADDPAALPHYRHSLFCAALGGAMGLGFGLLATSDGNEETRAGGMVGGLMGGYLVGAAYGANTVTTWHESRGSFALDLLAAMGTGVATILVGESFAEAAGPDHGDGIRSLYALGIWGTVPAGAVVAQRVVAGTPATLAAWHPQGTSPGTVGLVARWSFR